LAQASPVVRADLDRLDRLWDLARALGGGGGPYLFGDAFTAADAFFAPVAFRIEGYRLPVGASAAACCAALRGHAAVAAWSAAAGADPRRIALYEAL